VFFNNFLEILYDLNTALCIVYCKVVYDISDMSLGRH